MPVQVVGEPFRQMVQLLIQPVLLAAHHLQQAHHKLMVTLVFLADLVQQGDDDGTDRRNQGYFRLIALTLVIGYHLVTSAL